MTEETVTLSKTELDLLLSRVALLEGRVGTVPNPDPKQAGYKSLRCRKCGLTFPADHADPFEGGCSGYAHQSHDLYGTDAQVA
jgi:ribosomal protein S27AE